MQEIVNNIFSVTSVDFEALAISIFKYQYKQNEVYRRWVDALKIDPAGILHINEIPFLPVSFFKYEKVICGDENVEVVFTSSGTTQSVNSQHFVKDASLYTSSFTKGFQQFYGDVHDWCIIGLLPSYLERQGSSLVTMVDELIKQSAHPDSGVYLYDFQKLADVLTRLESAGQKTLIIGVTFALLDFSEQFPMRLRHTTIMETGGMKGRKREMIRKEVHQLLQQRLGVKTIHSEYGMTELLSQAYSAGDGIFKTVPWTKVLPRSEDDPQDVSITGRGILNVIDLANVYSCSFIATDDVGMVFDDGSFEVSGRMDASDIRGCSLLAL